LIIAGEDDDIDAVAEGDLAAVLVDALDRRRQDRCPKQAGIDIAEDNAALLTR